MTRYLLDSDICISFLKKKHEISEKINAIGKGNCFVSEITIAELKYGAEKSDNYAKHTQEVEEIRELFDVIPIIEHLDQFAKAKVRLQRTGTLIPDFDLLIGTTSVSGGFVMVTNNEKHLSRIEGIRIENWRKATSNEFLKP